MENKHHILIPHLENYTGVNFQLDHMYGFTITHKIKTPQKPRWLPNKKNPPK